VTFPDDLVLAFQDFVGQMQMPRGVQRHCFLETERNETSKGRRITDDGGLMMMAHSHAISYIIMITVCTHVNGWILTPEKVDTLH
jgi:hypothetical protein